MRPRALWPRERSGRLSWALPPSPTFPSIQVRDASAHLSLSTNSCQKLINSSVSCDPHHNLVVSFFNSHSTDETPRLREVRGVAQVTQLSLEPKPKDLFRMPGCPAYSTLFFHSFIFPSLRWWSLKRGLRAP